MAFHKVSHNGRVRGLPAFLAVWVCLSVAVCALADEPVWPADFAEKLAENRAASQPGDGQVATSGGSVAVSMCKWYTAFSNFVSLCTKVQQGFILSFR